MKLVRVRYRGGIRLGQLDDGVVHVLSEGTLGADQNSPLGVAVLAAAGWTDVQPFPSDLTLSLAQVVLLAPVPVPPKIIGVGPNYRRRALGSDAGTPEFPELFAKFANAIGDPESEIEIPGADADVDYEVELAVVIGRPVHRLRPGEGLRAVAGYSVANDVGARRWQRRGSQWIIGKISDGFCPMGPCLATRGSIPDPQALRLWAEMNGSRTQDGRTADMIFGVDDLVVYLSSILSLGPGDVILTGTPERVSRGEESRRFLHHGDSVRIGIDGIGSLSTRFVSAPPASQ